MLLSPNYLSPRSPQNILLLCSDNQQNTVGIRVQIEIAGCNDSSRAQGLEKFIGGGRRRLGANRDKHANDGVRKRRLTHRVDLPAARADGLTKFARVLKRFLISHDG